MAMTKSKRAELRKLREIIRVELWGRNCRFCKTALIAPDWIRIGNGVAAPVKEKLTYHHKNGDHNDHRPQNLQLVHRKCHKAHHMREGWKANGRFRKAA